ncbi:ABC transporter ATP-binding protein [Helicobacter sp. 11S03491-1]|uniref:ABC transporter ATP-binding protein n=1 Tax=Helicobacter sp. 11S03491-1 TaxID=1476196 RepID=UPI000BD48642|nr:ABC transporter ATP-binding protein [Helicobacter sp. 11S03491-1]PAF43739.1 hypothetical protein BKH45_00265 [Helicobacter sp. 11S03491-1]
MRESVYKIDMLKKNYDKKQVLSISNLEIYSGEIVGITGRNGSGKSTLLRAMAYLEYPNEGGVAYKGFLNPPLRLKREIALMFSEPTLLKRSVKENLIFGLKVRGRKYSQGEVFEVLELVGLEPSKFINRFYHELSSGESQRVALASRLIFSPKTLLLDEPTNSLDSDGLPRLNEAIKYAHQKFGSTIVIAAHDKSWLSQIISREIQLHFGRVIDPIASIFFSRHWHRDERGELFYDFGDGQILRLKNSSLIGKKVGAEIKVSWIKIFYNQIAEGYFGKIIAITQNKDEVILSVEIGIERMKTIISKEEYLKEKPYVYQDIWLKIGMEE